MKLIGKILGLVIVIFGLYNIYGNYMDYEESKKSPLTIKDELRAGKHMKIDVDNLSIIAIAKHGKTGNEAVEVTPPGDKDTYYYYTNLEGKNLAIKAYGEEAKFLYPYLEEFEKNGELSRPLVLEGQVFERDKLSDTMYKDFLKEVMGIENVDMKANDTSHVLNLDMNGDVLGGNLINYFIWAGVSLIGLIIFFKSFSKN